MRRPSRLKGGLINLVSLAASLVNFGMSSLVLLVVALSALSLQDALQRERARRPAPRVPHLPSQFLPPATARPGEEWRAPEAVVQATPPPLDASRDEGTSEEEAPQRDTAPALLEGAHDLIAGKSPLPIPRTAFASLIEHFMGRGDGCPPPYDTIKKCLRACRAKDLNHPIGLIYWKHISNDLWEEHWVKPYGPSELRRGDGPTYKVLFVPGADPLPPNAFNGEATILTLAPLNQIAPLIDAGADPDLYFGKDGHTALLAAATAGDVPRVQALVAAGANRQTLSARGLSPDLLVGYAVPNAEEIRHALGLSSLN